MTPRELAAIRDRAEACEEVYLTALAEEVVKRDVPTLLAEISRLHKRVRPCVCSPARTLGGVTDEPLDTPR